MGRFVSLLRVPLLRGAAVALAPGLVAAAVVITADPAVAAVPRQAAPIGTVTSNETPLGVPAAPSSPFESSAASTPGTSGASGASLAPADATAWSVSLFAPNTDISEGQTATLTAYLNQPLDGSGMAVYIYGYAEVGGIPQAVSLTTCTSGSSCTATAAWQQDPATFQAFVAPEGLYITDMLANSVADSNTVVIPSTGGGGGGGPLPWQVSLSVSPLLLARGKSVTAVAVANQSVAGSGYQVVIVENSPAAHVNSCGSGNGCTWNVPWTPYTQTYQAFIESPPSFGHPADVVAQSAPVTVTGLDWQVQLFAVGGMNAEVVSNRPVGASSSTALMIYDLNTKTVIGHCTGGRSCEATVPNKGDAAIGYVVPNPATKPGGVWLARTSGVLFPEGTSAGGNPAGLQDGRPCTCDPVDPADGALHESATDIVVPGRGPGLALTRDYESATAGVVSRFGFGWTDAYTMQLIPAPDDDGTMPTSLAAATNVEVLQENGTPVSFAGAADGSFASSPSMLASLTRNPDGTYTFIRMRRSHFTFDAYGDLVAEADLHGNTTTLAYDGSGRLSTVTDAAGRTMTYAYNDDGTVAKASGPGGRSETYGYDADGNLTAASDETDATWRYSYDSLHELTQVTDPNGHTTTNTFDDLGRVVAQTDGRGATTSFAYNDDGSTVITHPAGNTTTLTYRDGLLVQRTEGAGLDAATWQYQYDPVTFGLAQVVDPNGHVTAYTHDAAGDITTVTDAAGDTTTFTFDALKDQTGVTDAGGAKTLREYDAAGDLVKVTDPTGATTSYGYDSVGDRTSMTDADGHTTTYGYDQAGNAISVTDPSGATTTMTVDGVGQITARTDALGRTTSYGYDPRGLLTSTTNADDETTSYGYDASGQRVSISDATGRTWSYAYDGAGNLVRTTSPDGSFVATSYDPDGRTASISDAAGDTTSYSYDARGNLVSSTDPTGAATSYVRDPAGRLVSSTSPNGGTTSYSYDADDRATSVTDAVGGVSRTTYDSAGRIVSVVDPAGNVTAYAYDADGRVTATTRPDGSVERNTYDAAGLRASFTDAAGHTVSYGYDADGRRVAGTDSNGRTTTYAYDAASQLVSTTDAAGRVSTDSYDLAGRLVGVHYSDAHTPAVAYSYDSAGRRLAMTDGTGATTYTYDAAAHLIRVDSAVAGTVAYSYDGLGRVSSLTYPDGRVVTRSYDAAGRLGSESDGAGNTTSFSYDGDGNLVAIGYPNGVVQQQVFDPADRMTATSVRDAGGNVLDAFGYQLNALGLATSLAANGSAAPVPPAQTYTYNPLSQLTAVTTTGGPGDAASPTGGYAYDKAGNVTGLPDGTTLTYDAASQLTGSVGPGAIPTSYGFDPTADRTAQTTGGLTSTFGYDQASQLTTVAIPGRSPYHLMAGGEFFSLAVRGDGSVRAWGDNSHGELGDGGACGTTCPTEITVPGLPTTLQVGAGRDHALAVSTDGRVFAWGSNDHGQLGNSTATSASRPLRVAGLSDVVSVAAAGDSSYALTKNGTVYAWGENDQGQLGDGTTTDSTIPMKITDLPAVVDISAGALPDGPTHVLAATADGHAYTWGDADPHPADPTQAHEPTGGTDCKTDNGVGNGGTPGNGKGHANGDGNGAGGTGCKTDNGVGNGGTPGSGSGNGSGNASGNGAGSGHGNGGIPGNGQGHPQADLTPVLVDGVDHVVQVAAGGTSSYALTSAGAVFAWGDNHYGQLGLGLPTDVQTVNQPTQIAALPTIKMVAAGGAHALALSTRGQVFGWGDDNTGQLGEPGAGCVGDDDTLKTCPSPQLIEGVTASAVAAGYVHTLIATVYEHVEGLGRDAEGELGDGYAHPATQVGPAGDRNALGTPDGGVTGAKHALTEVTGLAQIRPQAPVTASYTYTGDGLRASSTTTVDDTTTVVPTTTTGTYTWDALAALPALLSDGSHDYLTGPGGLVFEQADTLGRPSASGTVFLHADRLGSTRLLTNTTGQPVGDYSYTPTGTRIQGDGLALLPYAQGIPQQQVNTPFGFAGSYTDPGTGWVYLQARYLDPTSDQFTAADPLAGLTHATYNYAADDSVNLTDPTGLGPATNPLSGNFWTKGNIFSDPVQKKLACGDSLWDSLVTSYDPVYLGMESYSVARDQGNSIYDSAVMAFDPAYQAINGYYNEVQAAEQGLPLSTQLKYGFQGAVGVAGTVGIATGVASGVSRFLSTSDIATEAGGGGKALWGFWSDYDKVTVGGREYADINGRLYTQHAVERMAPSGYGNAAGGVSGRSISPNFVEDVLDNPDSVTAVKGPNGEARLSYVSGSVQVITEDGIVVTIITR